MPAKPLTGGNWGRGPTDHMQLRVRADGRAQATVDPGDVLGPGNGRSTMIRCPCPCMGVRYNCRAWQTLRTGAPAQADRAHYITSELNPTLYAWGQYYAATMPAPPAMQGNESAMPSTHPCKVVQHRA